MIRGMFFTDAASFFQTNQFVSSVLREWFKTNLPHKKRYSEGGENIGGCRGLLRSVVNTMQWKVGTLEPPSMSDLFMCRERHRCGLGQ